MGFVAQIVSDEVSILIVKEEEKYYSTMAKPAKQRYKIRNWGIG